MGLPTQQDILDPQETKIAVYKLLNIATIDGFWRFKILKCSVFWGKI